MSLKKIFAVLSIGASLFFFVQSRAKAQTAIIENGAAKATIYLDAKSPSCVGMAARELQQHLKQISGFELPLSSDENKLTGYVIYLGDTAFARKQGIRVDQLPPDGFRILTGKNWMVIAGKDYGGPPKTGFNNPYRINESYNSKLGISAFGDAGTLFGVYHFLERYCGVRWYMPGSLGTVMPKAGKIVVPAIDLSRSPAYEQRHGYYGFMDRSDDDTLWYRRAGFGSTAPIQVTHSFGHFFLKYKDSHPEYFALIDGQRDFTNLSSVSGGGNLNLSNPGLIQQAIIDAIKYFDDNPEQKIFPLSPPDGWTKISEDPESQAQLDKSQGETGEFSNYLWGFINKVAKGVAKKYPDKQIGCIAYERYSKPPTNIERLEPNVAVVMTKFRATYPSGTNKKDTEERITNWSKKASVIYTWEYYCNIIFNPGWRGYPMFFSKLLQEDLKFQRGLSRGEFIEAESWTPDQYGTAPEQIKINYPGLQHLLLYVNARLLWDPDLDLRSTLDEYYRLFYGPAEAPMRGFWELVETNWNKKGWQSSPSQVYDAETIEKLLGYLKDAQAKSGEGSDYRQRVDLILSEFNPAAEVAQRLGKLSKPEAVVPAAVEGAGAMHGNAPLEQLIDRNVSIATPATNMQMVWDAQNLYVDMRCYEPTMDKLKTLATARDSIAPPIWEDDAVELFLVPVPANPADPTETLHLIVTAGGALFDSKISKVGMGENSAWNGSAKVTILKEPSRWVARLAIPWKDIGLANAQAGRSLTANFYRSRYAGGALQQSSWAPMMDGAFNAPQYFGRLTLGEPAPAIAALQDPAVIIPASDKHYGSGASALGFYYEGGIPDIGLFVGQPNPLPRNDRALFNYDLSSLLESVQKIRKVELAFSVQSVTGEPAQRRLNVVRLQRPVAAFSGETLIREDVDDAGDIDVTRDDVRSERSKLLDVTSLIRRDLEQGRASAVFRFRDVNAERDAAKGQPAGVTVGGDEHNRPALIVTFEE